MPDARKTPSRGSAHVRPRHLGPALRPRRARPLRRAPARHPAGRAEGTRSQAARSRPRPERPHRAARPRGAAQAARRRPAQGRAGQRPGRHAAHRDQPRRHARTCPTRCAPSAATTPGSCRSPTRCGARAPTSRSCRRTCRCACSSHGGLGIPAEEYRNEQVSDTGFTGLVDVDVSQEQVDELYATGQLDLGSHDLLVNTGVKLLGPNSSALGRIGHDKRIEHVRGDLAAFGIHGRSVEQRIALAHLLDPEIGIVSLGGPAGTGKSVLALAAALEAVLERRTAKRIMVFRPDPGRRRAGARLPARHRGREDEPLGRRGLRRAARDRAATTSSTRSAAAASSRSCR